MKDIQIVLAAGGNGTSIQVLEQPLSRGEYTKRGKEILAKTEPLGSEQAGFLIPDSHHFEMSGGEFCGNATRAASVLLANYDQQTEVSLTVSGFDGTVHSTVTPGRQNDTYLVTSRFPGMTIEPERVTLSAGLEAWLVDLGGIVHVVLFEAFVDDVQTYQQTHREVVQTLRLESREAVGVVWAKMQLDGVSIDPVVWVRDVDSFFYEGSCGSGSIAAAAVAKTSQVYQPTGKTIAVDITQSAVALSSEMEVISCSDSPPLSQG